MMLMRYKDTIILQSYCITSKTTSNPADSAAGGTAGGSPLPWFAIGGIDLGNVEQVVAAGAQRIVVVRAITEADDPAAAAKSLLAALDAGQQYS